MGQQSGCGLRGLPRACGDAVGSVRFKAVGGVVWCGITLNSLSKKRYPFRQTFVFLILHDPDLSRFVSLEGTLHSIHISAHRCTLVHFGTHEYTSAHISTLSHLVAPAHV